MGLGPHPAWALAHRTSCPPLGLALGLSGIVPRVSLTRGAHAPWWRRHQGAHVEDGEREGAVGLHPRRCVARAARKGCRHLVAPAAASGGKGSEGEEGEGGPKRRRRKAALP